MAYELLIKNARIVDPSQNMDETGDILVDDGRVKTIGKNLGAQAARQVDATGLVACPGFIDLHCHLREPGYEQKETIATGAAAAAHGGFTTICCMPNTNPPLDSVANIDYVKRTAALKAAMVNVFPVGCITKGRQGKELAELAELAAAGCVGFSDDGGSVDSSRIMLLAMQNTANLDLPILDHSEDMELAAGGHMNDGWVAARLGIKGIPAAAEESMIARNIALSETTGAKLHLTHISTRGSVELIRNARKKGLKVTCDVTPHHLTLTEERVMQRPVRDGVSIAFDTRAKVNPPLRTQADIDALIDGINDDTVTAIATDHAPHTLEDKLCEFELASFGISGFETAFGSLMTLVHSGRLTLDALIRCLTCNPASILRQAQATGSLRTASPADIVLLDINREWTVDSLTMLSLGKNTPWDKQQLKGMVMATLHRGEIAYLDNSIRIN
jgi:dihydroorotase